MNTKLNNEIIKNVLKIRISQILINEIIKKGELKIPIHLGLGHESIATAVDHIMGENDSLFLSHRNMHYNIAKTDSVKKEIDEYYLKSTGMASARLGSMNLSNKEKGIPYASSILGNNLSVATGYALGNSILLENCITIVVTGDGAIEEGSFYESLLFQKSNSLPVITIVENNEWSLGSKIDERRCDIDLEKMNDSLSIPYKNLNNNNPYDYIDELYMIKNYVLDKKMPFCVEVDIKTLGYWYEIQPEYPNGKFINYHSGKAPEITFDNNPIIENSKFDPVFVLQDIIGEELLMSLYKETATKLIDEIA